MNTLAAQPRGKLRLYIAVAGGAQFGDKLKGVWREAARKFGIPVERVRNIWRGKVMPKWDEGEAMRLIALGLAEEQAQELVEHKLELARQEHQHEQLKYRAARYYQRSHGADQGAREDLRGGAPEAEAGDGDRREAEGDPAARASAVPVGE